MAPAEHHPVRAGSLDQLQHFELAFKESANRYQSGHVHQY
jgi:hypothetical protein